MTTMVMPERAPRTYFYIDCPQCSWWARWADTHEEAQAAYAQHWRTFHEVKHT